MSREVRWNKIILEAFIADSIMSEDEEKVLRLHVAKWSRVKIATELDISLSTYDRIIAELKAMYDDAQKYDPILPPRKKTKHKRKSEII